MTVRLASLASAVKDPCDYISGLVTVGYSPDQPRRGGVGLSSELDKRGTREILGEVSGLVMVNRERILAGVARYMTVVGMILPVVYLAPIALFEISGYFGRLDLLTWMSDLAMLLSVPWELLATVLIILRWRDLPQRFWITYCVNGLLAYLSLPIYRMHFGLYR